MAINCHFEGNRFTTSIKLRMGTECLIRSIAGRMAGREVGKAMSRMSHPIACVLCLTYIVALIGCSGGEEPARSDHEVSGDAIKETVLSNPTSNSTPVQSVGNRAADDPGGDISTLSSQNQTITRHPVRAEPTASDLDFLEGDLSQEATSPPVVDRESNPTRSKAARQFRATDEYKQIILVDKYDDETLHLRWGVKRYSDRKIINHGVYQEFHRNGNKFCEGKYSDGARIGEWKFWHENGELGKQGAYLWSKPDGNWEIHREDGTLSAKESYADGFPDGRWEYYHTDGTTIVRQEDYKQGKRDGTWSVWYVPADGTNDKLQIKSISHFQDGRLHGEGTGWFPDGQQASLENYRQGKRHGSYRVWDRDGNVVSEGEHDDGVHK